MRSFLVLHLADDFAVSSWVVGSFTVSKKNNTFFVFPVFLTAKVYSVIVCTLGNMVNTF